MAYKNILVAFNGTVGALSALQYATLLSRRYDAHLTGILAHGLPAVAYSFGSYLSPTAMEEVTDADAKRRADIKRFFETSTTDMVADQLHFLEVTGEADTQIINAAHGYDLVVVGTVEPKCLYPHMEIHPDILARDAGRPVLVVPRGYATETTHGPVVLAWDGRRAAARAVADAIPLFDEGQEVIVLTVSKDDAAAEDVVTHLRRYGFNARTENKVKNGKQISDIIIETVEEVGAKMLIMGAYERPKFAEDLFGGVTNSVLETSPVPILMSH